MTAVGGPTVDGVGIRAALRSMTSSTPGRLLLGLLVVWVVVLLARPPGLAQDGVALLVAGELVAEDPTQVYVDRESGGIFQQQPLYEERYCEALVTLDVPDRTLCETSSVAYLSLPGLLPMLNVLAALGLHLGIQVIRLVGLVAAASAMAVLWGRLAGLGDRARWSLLAGAVLATPVVYLSINVGQTSTVLFASAAFGTGVRAGSGSWPRAIAWAGSVLVKASPVALGAVLAIQRRWAILAIGVGIVVATHLVVVALWGADLLGWFLDGSAAVSSRTADASYRTGYEGAVDQIAGSLPNGSVVAIAWGARVAVGALAAVGFFRLRDPDVQWAFAWVVLMALLPISWWHYGPVTFAALVVAVSRARRPEAWLWVPPAFLLVAFPFNFSLTRWNIALPLAVWTTAAAVAVYLLGRSAPTDAGVRHDEATSMATR